VRLWAALVLVAVGAACSESHTADVSLLDLPAEPIAEGGRDYSTVAWMSADELVVSYEPETTNVIGRLWTLHARNGQLERLDVQDDPGCSRRTFGLPRLLPDGRLGASQTCVDLGPPIDEDRSIVAITLATGAVERLVSVDGLIQGYSFRPGLSEGAVSLGNRVCEGLGSIRDGRVEPMQLRIQDGNQSFGVADIFPPGQEDCTSTGLADQAAWDPAGSRLALLASTAAIGVSGTDRLHVPWTLYVAEGDGGVRRVVSAIRDPNQIAWDLAGRWIAFGGSVGEHGTGTWAAEIDGDRLIRLSSRRADWLSWSPDGRELVIVADSDAGETPLTNDVLLIEVGAELSKR
jgi:hypothetical protein